MNKYRVFRTYLRFYMSTKLSYLKKKLQFNINIFGDHLDLLKYAIYRKSITPYGKDRNKIIFL